MSQSTNIPGSNVAPKAILGKRTEIYLKNLLWLLDYYELIKQWLVKLSAYPI